MNGHLYAAGGEWQRVIEYLDIETEDAIWQESNVTLPYDIQQGASVVVNDTVFISGGFVTSDRIGAGASAALIKWSVDSPSWTFLANMSNHQIDHCMVTDGIDHIWVTGPRTEDLEQYTISTNKWTTITSTPTDIDLNYRLCVYWDDHIIIRGKGTEGMFHVYDVTGNVWKISNVTETEKYWKPMIAIIPWQQK